MTRSTAPAPSVETILHALLPAKFVDHTHADALMSVMNTENGMQRVRELYGEKVVIVPYVMPGFRLARTCRDLVRRYVTKNSVGIVLMNHGLFTFGDSAKVPTSG